MSLVNFVVFYKMSCLLVLENKPLFVTVLCHAVVTQYEQVTAFSSLIFKIKTKT